MIICAFLFCRYNFNGLSVSCFLKEWNVINNKKANINEEIRDKEVRVIDSNGEQLGIMPVKRAIEIAYSKDLDLVNISPKTNPPVCKVMDYGKYCFEISKKEKEARKNQRIIEIKEIRLSLNIGSHDFDTKVAQAQKFLKNGHRIKITLRFKGRELMHINLGNGLINRFVENCSEFGLIEKLPKMEGRNMVCFIAPKQK